MTAILVKRGKNMDAQEIYRRIATEYGGSPEDVRAELQQALDAAWNSLHKTDTQAADQEEVPCKGEIPTVEEFLDYAVHLLQQ